MTNMDISEEVIQALIAVQRDIAVASWLDWQFDVNGNSYNPCEAVGGLKAAFLALGLRWDEYEPTREDLREAILAVDGDLDEYDIN